MTRYALAVNLDDCIGCHACEIACKTENNIALGEVWSKVIQVGPHGTFPNLEQYWIAVQCQQCEEAPCVHVCPTGASYRDADNRVLIDKEKCIGCKYCMMACPYGVRAWNESTRNVEKCTLCGHLTAAGKDPACVVACNAECRVYGDLDDPDSKISQMLITGKNNVHKLDDVGNKPSSFYILSDKIAQWINSSDIEPASQAVDALYKKKEA